MSPLAATTVMTVEDDPLVRADLRLILEDAGFAVCADARDGFEAVELARHHRPDLILLDLVLPSLDGVEATRRILGERDVPIVALTSHSNSPLLDLALEAGATATVTKPFSERQLVGTIRGVLADREAQQDRLRYLVERLVRDGYSEREIERAVRRATLR
jgi:CheY-like chemotaxis protein